MEFLKKNQPIRREIKERMASYIITAFGLVAGLAWNDAVKALIEYLFPFGTNTLSAKFIYAILISLAVVIITSYLVKASKEGDPSSG